MSMRCFNMPKRCCRNRLWKVPGGGQNTPFLPPPLDFSDRRFKIELGTQNFFEKLMQFCSSDSKFFGHPAPATHILGLWRSCRVPKYSQNDENFFANTLDCFWSRMKNFRPPRPGHPYFRPQKFLHIAIFSQKSPFLGCFRLKRGYLMSWGNIAPPILWIQIRGYRPSSAKFALDS